METKTICEVSQEQNQAHLFTDLRLKDIAPNWASTSWSGRGISNILVVDLV